LAAFVRLGGCNLACSWCDTSYTWDWTGKNGTVYDPRVELCVMTTDEILARLDNRLKEGEGIVVITGGEPLLQQQRLGELIDGCGLRGWPVEIETNGTVFPSLPLLSKVGRFNVSPKLANSGNVRAVRDRASALGAFALAHSGTIFKFVCRDTNDLDEVDEFVRTYNVTNDRVWIMPEGITTDAILVGMRALAPDVLQRGWNLSTRLHVLIWGNQRGV